ncbi:MULTISPECIES: hypothetical protein [Luteimonas]|uniref:hypothetical protein n=1 Tax=Luteimonas TaxID=83614 RepID=UPI000C7E5861|nr:MULTISPECIES: hypothetical protein [Luteimonas]
MVHAYVRSDRAAIDALLDKELRFYSPRDNGIGRDTHLALCWPTHVHVAGFDSVRLHAIGHEVVVTDVQHRVDGSASRHTG